MRAAANAGYERIEENGKIELYCTCAFRLMRSMPDGCIDALITDPPYANGATLTAKAASTASKYCAAKRDNPLPDFDGDSMDQRTWTHLMTDILREARRLCKPEAVCAIFIDWRQMPSLSDALQRAGWIWRGVVVWDKVNARPQRGRFTQQAEFVVWGSNGRLPVDRPVPILPGVYSVPGSGIQGRIHQTQKPLDLMRGIVKICVPGGTILDPFSGSGTTLLAAQMEGYNAIGSESNKTIAQAAAVRLGIELSV